MTTADDYTCADLDLGPAAHSLLDLGACKLLGETVSGSYLPGWQSGVDAIVHHAIDRGLDLFRQDGRCQAIKKDGTRCTMTRGLGHVSDPTSSWKTAIVCPGHWRASPERMWWEASMDTLVAKLVERATLRGAGPYPAHQQVAILYSEDEDPLFYACDKCNLEVAVKLLTRGVCPPCRSIASGHGL